MENYNKLPRVPYDPRNRWYPSTDAELEQAARYAGFGGGIGEPLDHFLNKERTRMGQYPKEEQVPQPTPVKEKRKAGRFAGRIIDKLLPKRNRRNPAQ